MLAFDLVGQGCAAALPNFQVGRALLGSGAAAHVLSVCVEVSSAAMYLDNDPGVLISAYFVQHAALADSAPSGWRWLCSFGAGFSCHGALLKVQ